MNTFLARLAVGNDSLMIAYVQYSNGQWLYFTCQELAVTGGECIAFPGDRDYYATLEEAEHAATEHYMRVGIEDSSNAYRAFQMIGLGIMNDSLTIWDSGPIVELTMFEEAENKHYDLACHPSGLITIEEQSK